MEYATLHFFFFMLQCSLLDRVSVVHDDSVSLEKLGGFISCKMVYEYSNNKIYLQNLGAFKREKVCYL